MAGDNFEFGGEIAWRPTAEYRERSRLRAFMARHALANYDALLRRSTDDPDWFWPAVLDDLGIEFYQPYTRFSTRRAASRGRAGASADNSTSSTTASTNGSARRPKRKAALRWEGEEGAYAHTHLRRAVPEGESLRERVRRPLASARATAWRCSCPCAPSSIVAFFATMKLGAIVLPLFSGYGGDAAASRLRDAEATLLVTADGFWRRGQTVAMKPVADEAADAAPSVRHRPGRLTPR